YGSRGTWWSVAMAAGCTDASPQELERLLTELMMLQQRLGQQLGARAVEELQRHVAGDHPLTVLIVGEFNAGKTTLVNALLGEAILPTGIVPTTATINVIGNGHEHSATVVYRDGREDQCPWDAQALQQFTARNGGQEAIAYITL